jgi:hypothetical protein
MRRPNSRTIRIAFSAACGLAAILLIVLCVRSYWHVDHLIIRYNAPHALRLHSRAGWFKARFAKVDTLTITSTIMPDIEFNEPRFYSYPIFTESTRWNSLARELSTSSMDGDRGIWMPYAIPFLLLAVAATLPWLRLRFSLRTLLIATTLIGLALGLFIATTR